jgi:hypothetical protein
VHSLLRTRCLTPECHLQHEFPRPQPLQKIIDSIDPPTARRKRSKHLVVDAVYHVTSPLSASDKKQTPNHLGIESCRNRKQLIPTLTEWFYLQMYVFILKPLTSAKLYHEKHRRWPESRTCKFQIINRNHGFNTNSNWNNHNQILHPINTLPRRSIVKLTDQQHLQSPYP